jgi:hypothetical protein
MSVFSCNITFTKVKGNSELSNKNKLLSHGFINESYEILNNDFYKASRELNLLASNKLGRNVSLYSFKNPIIQDDNFLYRGILGEPTIKNGNLILYPEKAEWQKKLEKSDLGISLSTKLKEAEHYGSWRFEQRKNQIMDEFMSEYDQEDEFTKLEETGYSIIQINKDFLKNYKKIQGVENESRIITDSILTIPKQYYTIETYNSEGLINNNVAIPNNEVFTEIDSINNLATFNLEGINYKNFSKERKINTENLFRNNNVITLEDGLLNVSIYSKYESQKKLAKKLLNNISNDIKKINVYKTDNIENLGEYRYNNLINLQEIYLSSKDFHYLNLEQTFLHEVIHAFTVQELKKNTILNKKFITFYNYVKKTLGKNSDFYYAFKNEKEFLAEILINPALQEELTKYKSIVGNKTLLDDFLQFLKDVFNFSKDETLLDDSFYFALQYLKLNKDENSIYRTLDSVSKEEYPIEESNFDINIPCVTK